MRNLILSIFLVFSGFGFSQNPYTISIDKSAGLPSNSVYDIFQDSKGFMWFATGKGLCRYDGTNFKTFTADCQTSKSGSCIQEDAFGRIWYANFDGFLYYIEKGVLKALPQTTSLGYFRFGILQNDLFLIQPNAVVVYDLKTLKIKKKHELPEKQVRFCYATSSHFYVLGDSLYEFSEAIQMKKHVLPPKFYEDIIGPIMNDYNRQLIINSKSNLAYYSFENGRFSKCKLNNSATFIQNISITDADIWTCTPNGIYKNNFKTNANTTYFTDQNISSVFKDKNNSYWISTLNKGVLFVESFENNFIALHPSPVSLALGKDEVFIGAEKDLIYTLNCKTFQTKKIVETESNHTVNQIYSDTINGKLFFTSFKFKILDKKNKITNEYPIAVKDIKKIDAKYFSFAASGALGLFYIDKNIKSKWDSLFEKNKNTNSSAFNQVALMTNTNGKSTEYNSTTNTLYYATNNGLTTITPEGKIKELKYKNKSLFLMKIQKYKEQIIGLSTAEKLYSINSNNEISLLELPEFIKKEKFNRFFILHQYCYLFASSGIYEYNLDTKNTQKIMSLSNDIDATDVVVKNNQLLFATSKGIVIKDRRKIGLFPQPKLIINEIQINGKRREINTLSELKPSENDVAINFSTLSFVPNENYSISYKINDAGWKKLDANEKNLKLSSLSAGTYTIHLVINHNDAKIDLQTIQFEILKPIWLNPFVLSGFGVLLVVLISSFYKVRIRKLEKRNQLLFEKVTLEKNLNQSKLKAIKSQMNPHFFYNALNTIQSFILSNDKKQAVTYLSKFSNLTRTILEMSEKECVSIAEEARTLSLYLDIEQARFEEDFSYKITIDPAIDADNIKIPTLLLQPYVENALKHGLLHKHGKKTVSIRFQKELEHLNISIDDNGIGRQKSAELNAIKNKNHNSFATEAIENRVQLLNQFNKKNISIHYYDKNNLSNHPIGTTVVFEIPITY